MEKGYYVHLHINKDAYNLDVEINLQSTNDGVGKQTVVRSTWGMEPSDRKHGLFHLATQITPTDEVKRCCTQRVHLCFHLCGPQAIHSKRTRVAVSWVDVGVNWEGPPGSRWGVWIFCIDVYGGCPNINM